MMSASTSAVAAEELKSDVDDYMSEVFIAHASSIRPGLARTANEKRALRIETAKADNVERQRKIPRRADLEREMREAGLAKPVGEESKGFALLQKMGYKPGMSIGVKREGSDEGIKIPITVDFKTSRSGLGHENEEKEKQKLRAELHLKAALARSKTNLLLLGDFRKRKRAAAVMKLVYGDLIRSRKACEELDTRKGLSSPVVPEFWPIYEVNDETGVARSARINQYDNKDERVIFKYSNGKLAPPELKFEELHDVELTDRLEDITHYLRDQHLYCIWCGCQYESVEDLNRQCPGNTRDAHDDGDE
uniref:G patch domain-containing protein 11 n=1 Tax=Syphacia muris TaxID=451379 RepID=A0A158R660_9BILA